MGLRNVTYVRVKDMTDEQKKELGIDASVKIGLVARETHNSNYNTKMVLIKKGIVDYILNGQ